MKIIPFHVNAKTLFIAGTNSPVELYARTFMAVHVLENAITMLELPEGFTLVTASYYRDVFDKLLRELNYHTLLEQEATNVGHLLVREAAEGQLRYRDQPVLCIFPATKDETKKYLMHWLRSNIKFLESRPTIANPLRARIKKRSEMGFYLLEK
jgi:hypothetical protein